MTAFSDLHKYVQTILGDIGITANYSVDQINKSISTALLLKMIGYEEDPANTIKPDVSGDSLKLLIWYSVWFLLNPKAGNFSYRTDILSVDRGARGKDPNTSLLERVEGEIFALENVNLVTAKDTVDKWMGETDEWDTKLSSL